MRYAARDSQVLHTTSMKNKYSNILREVNDHLR